MSINPAIFTLLQVWYRPWKWHNTRWLVVTCSLSVPSVRYGFWDRMIKPSWPCTMLRVTTPSNIPCLHYQHWFSYTAHTHTQTQTQTHTHTHRHFVTVCYHTTSRLHRVTACFLQSSEDLSLQTQFSLSILCVCTVTLVIMDTLLALTYLLTHSLHQHQYLGPVFPQRWKNRPLVTKLVR